MKWVVSLAASVGSTSNTAEEVLPVNAESMANRIALGGRTSARWMKSWSKAVPWIPSIRRAAELMRRM